MSSPTFTRRALIAGAGTTIASTALAVPYANAAHSTEACSLSVEPDSITDKIERLSQELSAVMGKYLGGDWKILIGSDDNISLLPSVSGSPRYRAEVHFASYRAAMMEADPTITGWYTSYCIDTGRLRAITVDHVTA